MAWGYISFIKKLFNANTIDGSYKYITCFFIVYWSVYTDKETYLKISGKMLKDLFCAAKYKEQTSFF